MQLGWMLWILVQTWLFSATTAQVEVRFVPEIAKGGQVHIAIYADEASFKAGDPALQKKTVELTTGQTHRVLFTDLPEGTYAIAAYQDVNKNDKLDTNLLGIPSEPYAFSNNPRAKWKAPDFTEVSFSAQAGQAIQQELTLLRWGKR